MKRPFRFATADFLPLSPAQPRCRRHN